MTHYQKYEELSQKIGIEEVREAIPVSKENIKKALTADDIHLNTIPLGLWDKAAGMLKTGNYISTGKFHLLWISPFTREKASGLSLAERVCILKHVAKYHY